MKQLHFNAIVIGFGKGGKTLAGKLAKSGKSVAVIEKDKNMYGGTCINVGCIPSKSLIHSAAASSGSIEKREETYAAAIEEKRRLTALLRQKNYDKLANLDSVTIFDGTGRFHNSQEIEVTTEKEVLSLTGDQIFINTGAAPRIPDIQGIKETKGVYTSEGMMNLVKLPRHLTIIGGGYIGLEFASMYAGFGSKVTVLQDTDVFLPREDEEISREIKNILEKQGVQFYLGAKIKKIENGPCVAFDWNGEEHNLKSDAVLAAAGRIPNTANLNCEAAGIELTDRGAVKVNDNLQTTAANVWALGDVTGGLQHTYVSLDDSRIVWSQLSSNKPYTASDRKNVPYSVFLSTPYSRVGMNEKEAIAAGYKIKIARLSSQAIPKAQVLKAADGMLKAIIDEETGKILGAMLLCGESYEIINFIKLAMDLGADYQTLRDHIYTHPTMTEAFNDLFDI